MVWPTLGSRTAKEQEQEPACDEQTNGHTTTAYTALAWRRDVKT